MAFHFNVPGADAAGRTGVILFLVLSGFLITDHLRAEMHAKGRLDLFQFYRRRALRIAPALGVLLIAATVAAGLGTEDRELAPAILATALFIANATYLVGIDLQWLSHMWTLSLEAQFYVAIPLVLMGLTRRSRAGAIAVLGAVVMLLYPAAAALAAGCALAVIGARPAAWFAMRAFPAIGLVAILFSAAIDNQSSVYNLAPTIFSSVGASLIVAAAAGGTSRRRRPSLGWVGRVSYSLYLWHLPIGTVLFPAAYAMGLSWWTAALASTAISVGVASVSYRWIERPFLPGRAIRYADSPPTAVHPAPSTA